MPHALPTSPEHTSRLGRSLRPRCQPRAAVAALAIYAVGLLACSGRTRTAADTTTLAAAPPAGGAAAIPALATSPAAADSVVPAAVDEVGTHGEDLYDAVTAGQWRAARAITDSLARSASRIAPDSRLAAYRAQLSTLVDTLNRAVSAHDRATAAEAANRVTYLSARMTEPFRPATPTGVLLLDYYGREVDIWAARRDTTRLRATANDLERTWHALRPDIVAHGGAHQAARTDSLVNRIQRATTLAAYTRAAAPFLDEVDELEKVYTRQ